MRLFSTISILLFCTLRLVAQNKSDTVTPKASGGTTTTTTGTQLSMFTFPCDTQTELNCTVTQNGSNYTVHIQIGKSTAADSNFDYNLSEKVYTDEIARWLSNHITTTHGCSVNNFQTLGGRILDLVQNTQKTATVSKDQKIIDSLAGLLVDQNRLGGAIHVLKIKVPIYVYSTKTTKHLFGIKSDSVIFTSLDTNQIYLEIPSVFVQFDYNRLSNVTLHEPKLHIVRSKGDVIVNLPPTSNPSFSISLPGLNQRKYYTAIPIILPDSLLSGIATGDAKGGPRQVQAQLLADINQSFSYIQDSTSKKDSAKINQLKSKLLKLGDLNLGNINNSKQISEPDFPTLYFNYGDFLHYGPIGDNYTFIVRNDQFQVKADSVHKVYRRNYSEYLSFRTFLDPLGFLSNSANGFAQLEGDMILPLNLKSTRNTTWIPQAHFNLNYIYSNSINSEPRIAPVQTLSTVYPGDTVRARYFHNLDLMRYAYYQYYGRFSVFAIEMKSLNSWLHFELGLRGLGAKVFTDTTNKNSDSSIIIHKIMPGFNLRLEIRPDAIIGGDVNLGIDLLGNVHKGNNNPGNINNPSFLYRTSWAMSHEVNLYMMTATGSKGGLFFRYQGWLAVDKQLAPGIDQKLNGLYGSTINKTSYVPQILLGYSTNIGALVKRSTSQQ